MTFLDHAFRLLCVRGVRARVDIAPKPIEWSADRKALTRAAETVVRQRFVADPGAPQDPTTIG